MLNPAHSADAQEAAIGPPLVKAPRAPVATALWSRGLHVVLLSLSETEYHKNILK